MTYGLPYQGSKSRIARGIVGMLPKAQVFVDLFAGGCALTHAAMLSGKWKRFIANDLDPRYPQLFKDCCEGRRKDLRRWISREEFFRLKDSDPAVALCWSFGNDTRSYIFAKEKEAEKKALWERQAAERGPDAFSWGEERAGRRVESLPCIKRLESLEGTPNADRLEISGKDYRDVEIPENSVIVCDIPYRNTDTSAYGKGFDHEAFYDWAEKQKSIFICEYGMPSERFRPVRTAKLMRLMATGNQGDVLDRVYVPRKSGWVDEESLFEPGWEESSPLRSEPALAHPRAPDA